MYFTLILGCAILQTNTFAPYGWGQYLSFILFYCVTFIPTLLFIFKKEQLRISLKTGFFYLLWGIGFIAWPIGVGIFVQEISPLKDLIAYEEDGFVLLGASIFFLALALELFRFSEKRLKKINWIRKFSLEKAFFLIMIISSLFIAMLVTSNLEDFQQSHTIPISVSLLKVLSKLPVFVFIFFQFLLLYAVAYLFYLINHHLLIGLLLKKKGLIHYVMGVLGTVVLLYPVLAQLLIWLPIHQELQVLVPSENMLPFDYLNGGVSFIVIFISLPIILVFQWFQQNNQIMSLEKQQIQTELDLLKQQINPHFFFNTLNNLYALSQIQSPQTPEVILQLSELMRYVIYRGKEPRVKLVEELNYLKDYCSLQQIRLHKKLDFSFEVEVEDQSIQIPPLLLVVLVENAFKHGIEPAEHPAFLHLRLENRGSQIHFTCENSFEGLQTQERGIGLENLSRRLRLLFGENYDLQLEVKDAIFKVQLSLRLQ